MIQLKCFTIYSNYQKDEKRGQCSVVKPWPNDSQVDASFGLESFGHPLAWTCIDLRRLAWTCVDFGRAQIWMQVDASFLPFGHSARVDTSWSQVICCYKNASTNDMREIYGFLRLASWLTCESVWPPFASSYASSVLQVCVDLRPLASPFGQGLNQVKIRKFDPNRKFLYEIIIIVRSM